MFVKMIKGIAGVCISTALIGAIGTASAAPVIHTNLTSFQNAASTAGIGLGFDSFDTHPTGTLPRSANGITVSTNNDGRIDTAILGSGNSVQFDTQVGGTSITFTFATAINAFGLDIFDLGTMPGASILTMTSTAGAQTVFSFSGSSGNQLFGGVIDTTTSFTSVTVSNDVAIDWVELDNLRYGAGPAAASASNDVPEPATLSLFGLGLAGLGYMRRRRAT